MRGLLDCVSGLNHPEHSPWARDAAKRETLADRVEVTHEDPADLVAESMELVAVRGCLPG